MYELLLVLTMLTGAGGGATYKAISVSQTHIPGSMSLESCNANGLAWQERVRATSSYDIKVVTTWSCIKK